MVKIIFRLVVIGLFFVVITDLSALKVRITKEEVGQIGYKIYKNECGLKPENLTHWNEGENFASMGLGHFLWYPAESRHVHEATFPMLLTYLKKCGVKLPSWLSNNYNACPWNSQAAFNRDINSYKMRVLREFLQKTMYYQTLYIINRFNSSIPNILMAAKKRGTEKDVKEQLYRVAESCMGMYVLIDYSNFKGTGTNPKGGQWGLLQVLENMKGSGTGRVACSDFAKSAAFVLKRRVINSSNRKQEEKWYPGWIKRLETYYM